MIEQIDIQNFRSFKELRLREIQPVTLIFGDNGSGKTSLLEELFLACGASPELLQRTKAWRGMDAKHYSGQVEDVDRALWGDVFHQLNTDVKAKISLRGTQSHERRSVTITYRDGGITKLVPPSRDQTRTKAGLVRGNRVRFEYHVDGYGDFVVEPYVQNGQLVIDNQFEANFKASFVSSSRLGFSGETATRFSKLSVNYDSETFVSQFRKKFESIKGLSIETMGGNPMLYASVEGLSQKIPLGSVSGGMTKLATILLSMSEHKNGCIIIDEIENGFYFDRMEEIWAVILEFSDVYNCQIFASTHSYECMKALNRASGETNFEEYTYLRTELKDGVTKVYRVPGKSLLRALEYNIEVR